MGLWILDNQLGRGEKNPVWNLTWSKSFTDH